MTGVTLLVEPPILGPVLDDLVARATELANGARAANTRKAYRSDWAHFSPWCVSCGLNVLPGAPAAVGLYLTAHADTLSVATRVRWVSLIATVHRLARHPMDVHHPAICNVLRGLRREKGDAEALIVPLLRRLLPTCGDRLID